MWENKPSNGKSLNRSECPAFGKTCDACGMENHFKKVCGKRLSQAGFLKMNDDTTGSEMSEEECSDVENTDTEDDNSATSYHYAAKAQDFCCRHHQQNPR